MKRMKPALLLPAVLFLPFLTLAGCQSTPRVVVDPKGIDQAAYDRDLAECSTLADEARKGSSSTARGALGGAVIGGSSGASQDTSEKDRILKNCMTGRGYRVLN